MTSFYFAQFQHILFTWAPNTSKLSGTAQCHKVIFCCYLNTINPSTPAVPNWCCLMGSAAYWSNPPFLIFDIRALWHSVLCTRVPECQKFKMVGKTSMAKCKALMGLAVKGLPITASNYNDCLLMHSSHNNAHLCREIFGCRNKKVHVFWQLDVVDLFAVISYSSTHLLCLTDSTTDHSRQTNTTEQTQNVKWHDTKSISDNIIISALAPRINAI